MTTMMSPRNMLLAGIVLVLLNVAALAPMATGAVEGAVEDNFASFSKDSVCANDDCTEAEEDWASSTSPRDFYGYSITNVADVMANGSTPVYEKIGPVTYDITTTRTILDYDSAAGELTYNSVKSFACSADTVVPCDTEVSQLNIAFQTQVIGATGTAIAGIMDLTKAAFTAGAIGQEMESFSAGKTAALWVSNTMAGYQAGAFTDGATMDAATASTMIGTGWYDLFDAFFAATNMSNMNNMTGMGETITYTQAIQGQQAAAGGVTFTGNASITDLTYAFEAAVMPTGEDVALSGMVGVMALSGHCNAFPTATYDEVMADAENGFANVGTMQRASIWGYTVMASETMPDVNATIANDFAVCFGIGGMFANVFGGGDDDWFMDQSGTAVNASTRMMNYLDLEIDNTVAMGLLFGGNGEEVPTGLLATNPEGTSFGVANFFAMDADTAKATYMLDDTQYATVYAWVGGWLGSVSSLPMVLLGGTGDMTAEEFVNVTFGNEDPVNGGYLENSLNLGGLWGMPEGRENIALDPAVSGNALYGPLGLTTRTGASIFIYGELSGMTPPIDFATMGPGTPMVWDEATIGALYGVDINAASAMRALMMGPIYGTTADSFVPGFLMSSFGTAPYLTQSFNNWLLGWHDPVSAFLATGNPMDTSVGWTSLESNETYFSSDVLNGGVAIANGDGTNYTMCTGEVDTCDKGETLAEDGSTQLSWRNDAMMTATFGLITPESLVGTTGGFLTGTDDKVDVSGYAIADIDCDGTSEVKGIPVDDCSATVVATERNIQANLLETYSLLDATPGALPVYFGSDITMQAEQLSGLIIAGESKSTFFLDVRAHGSQASTPSMSDLVPVFEIHSSSMIEDSDAEEMESAIVQNQDKMRYWTNFDSWIDYVTLLFWVGGIAMIGTGMVGAANAPTEEEAKDDAASPDED